MGKVKKFQNKSNNSNKNSPNGKSPKNSHQGKSPRNSPRDVPQNGVQKNKRRGKKHFQKQQKPFPKKEQEEESTLQNDSNLSLTSPETKNKTMKMFPGTKKSPDAKKPKEEKVSNDEDDMSDDDDNSDDSKTNVSLKPKDLLGKSFADNSDEDDDDFQADDDTSKEISLGAKDLLGESFADDDSDDTVVDDDTFVADDDDDESSDSELSDDEIEKEEKEKLEEDTKEILKPDEEKLKRTIFVGNLKVDTTLMELKKIFAKFGAIESVRFRGAVGKDKKMSKKVVGKTKQYHPKLASIFAYMVFKEKESAEKATKMNGEEFKGSKLRVTLASENGGHEEKKSVFLGNLAFEITDDQVHEHFKKCGPIESIRIIRDGKSQLGKGFGYINFKSEDSVKIAMEMNETTLEGRKVRVKLTNLLSEAGKTRRPFRVSHSRFRKRKYDSQSESRADSKSPKSKKQKPNFAGQKAGVKKNKKTINKATQQKKQMAAKLTAKKRVKAE